LGSAPTLFIDKNQRVRRSAVFDVAGKNNLKRHAKSAAKKINTHASPEWGCILDADIYDDFAHSIMAVAH
jgi:hypothetical protein